MNIIEYVQDSHKTFAEKPFGAVDSMVLCELFYAKIENIIDGEGLDRREPGLSVKDYNKAEYFDQVFNDAITDEDNRRIFAAASASRRFRDLKLVNIKATLDVEREEQFAAVTFELDDETDYVCFRGTDGTMLGWKEDFQMSFKPVIPSQRSALKYVMEQYGEGCPREGKRFYIGGHSKGGNLAGFGAFMSSDTVRAKIISIFSHDGPGFRDEIVEAMLKNGEDIDDRLIRQIPQSSVIGMLLSQEREYCVVKSGSLGIFQHNAYKWEIENDEFVELKHITKSSEYIDRTIHNWLMSASDEQREIFVDSIFSLFSDNGIETVHDLRALTPTKAIGFIRSFDRLDSEARDAVSEVTKSLLSAAVHEILPDRIIDLI